MKKIVIKLLIFIIMFCGVVAFFNKYEFINTSRDNVISREYNNKLIGVSKDGSISYNVYDGGSSPAYENKYFLEYSAEYANQKQPNFLARVNIKKRTDISSNPKASSKLLKLKVSVKNDKGEIKYSTSNLVRKAKNLGNNYLFPEYMYLTMNDKNQLILNIPVGKGIIDMKIILGKYLGAIDDKFPNKIYKYNLNTNKSSIVKEKIDFDYKTITENLPISYNIDKYSLSRKDGVTSVIIYNGSQYYKTHKDAKIFKEFPKLKKYLENHRNTSHININFKDNISDNQIVEYLK